MTVTVPVSEGIRFFADSGQRPGCRVLAALVLGAVLLIGPSAWALEIQRVVSPGGLEAWLVEDHKVPVIAVEFAFQGGSALDPAGKSGLASLTADLLDEGAGDLDSQAFAKRVQDDAITMTFTATVDAIAGSLKTLSANGDSAFDLTALALAHPRFDAEALERVRNAIIGDIRQGQADPSRVARLAFYAHLFSDHPYGRDPLGTPEGLAAVGVDDLRGFVARTLVRENLLVAVTGDISPERLGVVLDRVFGGLPATGASAAVAEAVPQHQGETLVVTRPIAQSVILFGQQGVKRADPDWFPAYIMNYVLGGGGFSSRMTEEVREKRGLSYGVYSYLYPFDHAALIIGGGATVNAKAGETLALMRQEWWRMAQDGITADELRNAKTYLTGSFPLQFSSASAIARTVLQVRHDRLGLDYLKRRDALIEAVTVEDVKRVAARLLDSARLTTVVVGRPEGLSGERSGLTP